MEALEAKYPKSLTIIGVHSAKFPNEREAVSLRHAIRRHQITHPVVNDAQFAIWQRYGVRAWPTLVVIDPAGYVVGSVAGEGHGPALEELIGKLISEHLAAGTLREGALTIVRPEGTDDSLLAFPRYVAAATCKEGICHPPVLDGNSLGFSARRLVVLKEHGLS